MIKWQRDKNIFARRIVHSDLKNFLLKGFIIEQGTKGMVFENGELQEIVSCGRIGNSSNLLDRLLTLNFTRNIEIIVCEAGEISLVYLYGGENPITGNLKSPIYTKDELPLQVGIEIVLQLHSPQLFMLNILKGVNELPVAGLKGRYFKTIQNELVKFICKHNIVNLANTPDLKNHCCDEVEQNIASVFENDGFEVIKVRSVTFYNPDFEKLREQKVALKIDGAHQILEYKNKQQELENREKWIQLRHKERELQIKKSALDQQDKLAQQKVDDHFAGKKIKHKIDTYEAQVELWDKLRDYKNQEAMKKITSKEELETFIDEIDTQKVMRKEQKEKLLREFKEQNEDHKRGRAFVVAQAEMEHQYALKSMELSKKQDFNDQEVGYRLKQERKLMEHEFNKKKMALSSELEMQKIKEIESIQAQSRKTMADLEKRKHELEFEKDEAKSRAEIVQINMQIQEQRAESALRIKEKSLAIERKDMFEKEKHKLEMEDGKLRQMLSLREADRIDKQQLLKHEVTMKELDIQKEAIMKRKTDTTTPASCPACGMQLKRGDSFCQNCENAL